MTRMSVAAVMSILFLRGSEVVHRYPESSKYSFMNHDPPVAAFSARRRVMAYLTEVKMTRMSMAAVMSFVILRGSEVVHRYSFMVPHSIFGKTVG